MIWETRVTPSTQEEDLHGALGPGAVMRLMHEAAEAQVSALGPRSQELREAGRAFLVSRFALDLPCPLRGGQEAEVRTWSCPSRGYSFLRCYEIRVGGQVCARGRAVMALVDLADRRLRRVEDYHPGFGPEEDRPTMMPERITFPPEAELTPLGTHVVRYADADINLHMNNTRYADVFCGFADLAGARVSGMSLSYRREAPLGGELSFWALRTEGGTVLLRALLPDGTVSAEAALTVQDL